MLVFHHLSKQKILDHNGVEDAIMGSSNFTVRGIGLSSTGNNIELNLKVDSKRDRQDLKAIHLLQNSIPHL